MSNAVFLASGKSSRMWPISEKIPKGLIRVKGEVLVERQIKQLLSQNVQDITFVTSEANLDSWRYLEDMFSIQFIVNDKPDLGNWYTLKLFGHLLGDTFVCSVDDYFPTDIMHPAPFRSEETSWYGFTFTSVPKDEWFISNKDGFIDSVLKANATGGYMCGCAYLTEKDGKRLAEYLYDFNGSDEMWEDVFLAHTQTIKMRARHIGVVEFDSIRDVIEYDPDFLPRIGGGETNDTYLWGDKVIRIPGSDGVGATIDRSNERLVNSMAAEAGVDKSWLGQKNGVKLSQYVESKPVSPTDWGKVKEAFSLIKKVHMFDGRGVNRFEPLDDAQSLLMANTGLSGWDELFERYRLLSSIGRAYGDGRIRCVCHNDFHPGNLLDGKDGMSIIDWEYAGFGDAMNDIGSWLSCVSYSVDEALTAISIYGADEMACIRAAERCSFRWYVWCLVQEASGLDMEGWTELCKANLDMYGRMRKL